MKVLAAGQHPLLNAVDVLAGLCLQLCLFRLGEWTALKSKPRWCFFKRLMNKV